MGTIKTKLDGVVFNEYLKKTAQVADKITVCRSMTHGEAAHERGTHNMFTGYRPSPALHLPEHGQRRQPRVRPAQQPAALRLRAEPCRPTSPAAATCPAPTPRSASAATRPTPASRVQDLTLPGGVDDKRFTSRRNMLDAVNDHFAEQGEGRRPRRDGHLLPAGLQPDQLARRPRTPSTSTPRSRPSSATSTAATPPASGC